MNYMSNNPILKTININKTFKVKRNFFLDSAMNFVSAVKNVSITLEKGKIADILVVDGNPDEAAELWEERLSQGDVHLRQTPPLSNPTT